MTGDGPDSLCLVKLGLAEGVESSDVVHGCPQALTPADTRQRNDDRRMTLVAAVYSIMHSIWSVFYTTEGYSFTIIY